MKSYFSQKSENLSYISKVANNFSMGLVNPLLLVVFIPQIAEYAVPVATMFGTFITFITQRGFAKNAIKRNRFGVMLDFTRENLMEVMILDGFLFLSNIAALYFYPTAGYMTIPLTGILNYFIDQVVAEDSNKIFASDSDGGEFRTYYDNMKTQYGTGAAFLGNGMSILLTTVFTVDFTQCVILLIIKEVIVFPIVVCRRSSVREDAIKMIVHER